MSNTPNDGNGNNDATNEQSTPQVPDAWNAFITPFAEAIKKSPAEVTTSLKEVVGEPGQDAIDALKNEEFAPFEDLKEKFSDVPTARLRMAVKKHLRASEEAEEVTPATSVTTASFDLLPAVPDDESWLAALKTGGELKVDTTEVISAVRAGLASRTGLYELPAKLVELMERHAEVLEEPVGEDFFKLRKMLTRRSYAEIFAALDIEGGNFVTEKRKRSFMGRLDDILWQSLLSFQDQVKAWTESWQQGLSNPAMMMGAFAAIASGQRGVLPAGMVEPPSTDNLRDAAEAVNDQVNKIFSGVGIPIARALAFDALNVKKVLENPKLPLQVGAANRDQMLKQLGVDVSADYVRLERNVTRYTLGVMEYPKVTAGQEDLGYLQSLMMLGSQIPWDRLSTPRGNSSVSRTSNRRRREFDDE